MVTTVYIPINSKIYIPATVPFLYMLADIYLYFLNDNYPNRCEVISLCGCLLYTSDAADDTCVV